jgi:iron complex transport system ATP-binding protein
MVELVDRVVSDEAAGRRTEAAQEAVIAVRGVAVGYGGQPVIRGVDLDIARGELVALCGPNGSGKSTLLGALAGLQPVSQGEIRVAGSALGRLSRRELARRVAHLPQQPIAPEGLTVREVVALARYPHRRALGGLQVSDKRAVTEALERAEVAELANRPVEQLSGGERQRVWIALTLAQEADILLLDEPTTFLDPQHQVGVLRRMRRLARELDLTVVWVLHDLNQAAGYSDRMILLKDGGIAAAGVPEAVLTEDTVRRVFELETLIMPHPETGRPLCVPRT